MLDPTRTSKNLFRQSKNYLGYFAFTALALLAGCAPSMPLLPERAPLPPSLLTPCPALSILEDGSRAAVLRKLVEISALYHECSQRQAALSQAVDPGSSGSPDPAAPHN